MVKSNGACCPYPSGSVEQMSSNLAPTTPAHEGAITETSRHRPGVTSGAPPTGWVARHTGLRPRPRARGLNGRWRWNSHASPRPAFFRNDLPQPPPAAVATRLPIEICEVLRAPSPVVLRRSCSVEGMISCRRIYLKGCLARMMCLSGLARTKSLQSAITSSLPMSCGSGVRRRGRWR